MLTATQSGTNIILKSTLTGYQLERRIDTGSWEPWTGMGWGGVPIVLTTPNFTDYDLSDGIYQYRSLLSGEYEFSNCIPIGSDPVGWTFQNYIVPEGQFGEILTADDLQYTFLWGIDFTASNGEVWRQTQTQTMIQWAIDQLEKILTIDIFPRQYFCDDEQNASVEASKFVIKEFPYPNRRKRQFLIMSRHRPIREVTRFDFFSPVDTKVLDLMQWMRLDKRNGKIWYYPKQGRAETFTTFGWPWNLMLETIDYPDAFHLDYTTGYATAELIPEDLRDIVGKIAALKMLNAIGDGLLAGFSSSSISLDGLSESFSSTQSATNAYFGARIGVYQKDIDNYIAMNRNKYGNFRIGSF